MEKIQTSGRWRTVERLAPDLAAKQGPLLMVIAEDNIKSQTLYPSLIWPREGLICQVFIPVIF